MSNSHGVDKRYEIDSPMDFWQLRGDFKGTYELLERHGKLMDVGIDRDLDEIEAEMREEVLAVQIALPAWLDHPSMCDGAQGGLLANNANVIGLKLTLVMEAEWDVYHLSGRRHDLFALAAHLERQLLKEIVVHVSEYAPGSQALDCILAAQISGAVRGTKVDIPRPKYRSRFHVAGTVTGPLIGVAVVTGGLRDNVASYSGQPTLAETRKQILNPQPPKPPRKFPWFRGLS